MSDNIKLTKLGLGFNVASEKIAQKTHIAWAFLLAKKPMA